MILRNRKYVKYFFVSLLIFGLIPVGYASSDKAPCRIVYDGGSSGTRLYIYEKQNAKWLQHEGPKVSALADPVREIRGKTWTDADAVINDVVEALKNIKSNGPSNDKGRPEWMAFDWSAKCHITTANVYATAGMRLAEQQNPNRSKLLWLKLKQALSKQLGDKIVIDARTLTGFEEGLYAWLSVRDNRGSSDFGVVEMGGASSQITFPCEKCQTARTIILANQSFKVFSYSFLGLGGDEAAKVFGIKPACEYAVGKANPQWTEDACASSIQIKTGQGIYDPYNIGDKKSRGTYKAIPIQHSDATQWVLTGAFSFMKDSDVDTCCKQAGSCFNMETSCFRAIYSKKYLHVMGIKSRETAESSWTLGAAICEENNCLRNSGQLKCRWLGHACL